MRLVVNADDLGLHPRIDDGILAAHRDGIVTSASLLATGRTAEQSIRAANSAGLALGLHLCLVTSLPPALPAAQVPSLVVNGTFRPSWADLVKAWALGQVRAEEIAAEWKAQLELARRLGAKIDHLDGHQHVHVLPGLSKVVRALADEEGLPVRWPSERPRPLSPKAVVLSCLCAMAKKPLRTLPLAALSSSGALNEAALLSALDGLPGGDFDLICHPGRDPGVVPEDPSWRYGWEVELAALTSMKVRERVAARGIELTTYGQLFNGAGTAKAR